MQLYWDDANLGERRGRKRWEEREREEGGIDKTGGGRERKRGKRREGGIEKVRREGGRGTEDGGGGTEDGGGRRDRGWGGERKRVRADVGLQTSTGNVHKNGNHRDKLCVHIKGIPYRQRW